MSQSEDDFGLKITFGVISNHCLEKFGKEYRLCSKKMIGELFKQGKQLRSFPFSINYKVQSFESKVPFQVVLAAPKRNFKRAHDRNYVKRLMREALRKHKGVLEEVLLRHEKQMILFIVFNQREIPDYTMIEKGMRKCIDKLTGELEFD